MTEPFLVATPAWPIFSVRGPDSVSWLNGIVTADVNETQKGRGVFGLLLTKHGKVQGELQMTGSGGNVFVAVSGGVFADVVDTLKRYLVMEDAEIEVEETLRTLIVVGSDEASYGYPIAWAKEPATIFIGTPADVEDKRARALETGAALVDFDAPEVRYRLGLPLYGRDYSIEDNPHDSSLERRAVNWSKGCYLGQEVVCMQDMRGKPKRRLVRLLGPTSGVSSGDKVKLGIDLDEVGTVTTVAPEGLIARVKAPHCDAASLIVGSESFRIAPLLG